MVIGFSSRFVWLFLLELYTPTTMLLPLQIHHTTLRDVPLIPLPPLQPSFPKNDFRSPLWSHHLARQADPATRTFTSLSIITINRSAASGEDFHPQGHGVVYNDVISSTANRRRSAFKEAEGGQPQVDDKPPCGEEPAADPTSDSA